jgi:predicted TIM-barrel fold metal-dependent hydrolase
MRTENTIIDIHCHTAGIGAGGSGCFVSPEMRRSWRYHVYLKAFGVKESELVKQGDDLILMRLSTSLAASGSVTEAVVLAMDGVVGEDGELDLSRTEIYIPNEFLAREVRRFPNLLFGASINPYRRDALQRLEQATHDGAVLMKWLPSIQHIDPADQRLIPFYRRLKELGMPLLTHTGSESSFTWKKDELADPERLRLPLSLGVTVVAAHAASNGRNQGEANFSRFLRLCNEFPNLYADISALTQANRLGHLTRLLRHTALYGRLLYGSDMPLLTTGITSPWFHAYRLSPPALWRIVRKKNPWDRDVALKRALGATDEMFVNTRRILRLSAHKPVSREAQP